MIPSSRINQTSKSVQDQFFALPNFGNTAVFSNGNYRDQRKTVRFSNPTITSRIDQRINDKVFIYGRWSAVRWNIPAFDTNVPTVNEMFRRRRDMDAVTLSYSHTLSTSMINEFRYGFTRQDFPRESPVKGKALVEELGLKGLFPNLPDVGGMPGFTFTGIGITGLGVSTFCEPCSRHRIHNFTENLSWFRGKHSLKMGAYFAWQQYTQLAQDSALFGSTEYSNRYTGHPYADFLLGIPTTMRRAAPAIQPDTRHNDWALYITDEWKMTPSITLTAGVRWDVRSPWYESNNRMAVFDVNSGNVVVPDGGLENVSPLIPRNYVTVVEASQAGFPKNLVKTDWSNFAPRLGLAWRPFGNNTVFRGGFGFYYDTAAWQPSSGGAPFVLNEPPYTNQLTDPLVLPTVFPSAGAGGPASFNLPSGIRTDLRIPLSMQYTATIEHTQWSTGFRFTYTGTNTRQGIYGRNYNQPAVDANFFVDKIRPYPRYPNINYVDNGAGHQYHAFTTEIERRMARGLHFQAHYTLASDIGDLERGASPENAFDRARERSKWERYPNNRFSGNFVYQLPFGKGRPWASNMHPAANAILGGWEISGIVALENGRYTTPLWRGPDPTGTAFTAGRNRPLVTIRPDHLHNANISNPTVDRWFDPAAFAAPPIGRFGSAAKGVIFGAPTQVLHGSVAKHFFIKERARLRIEMLATNALNHPNYQDPNTRIDQAGAVGTITAVINRNLKFDSAIPRELQAQIRLEW
jgi:hypothetical protein